MVSVKNTLRNIANNNIYSLILEKHIFSPNDCVRVFKAISNNTSLTGLTIRGCRTDMDALTIMLSNNNSLSSLTLRHIELTDNDIYRLASALSFNTNLKMLCISETINKEPLKELTKALMTNTSITYLDLSGCNIDDTDIPLITDMLSKNTSITSLNLDFTDIGDKGIVELMTNPNNLLSLNLNHTAISTNVLTKTMMNNTNIIYIFVDNTPITLNKLLARNFIHKQYKCRFDIPDELNSLVNKYISNYCYCLV
jgi:hypothetical protein